MRFFLGIAALSLFVQAAQAKDPDCRDIEGSISRLACYDAAFPMKKKPAVGGDDTMRPPYKDPFVEEEARVAAKLKHICRGC